MAALSVPPSQFWSNYDGTWSTFALQVGSPPAAVDVHISTSQTIDYLINPQGCRPNDTTCAAGRGGFYDPTHSTTWHLINWYTVDVDANLGYTQHGEYGYDTVALGYQGGTVAALGNQIVASIAGNDFYYGLFGISPKPFNFTDYNNPYPSYLESLKNQSQIQSLSWGYTAGASYQLNGVFGSLTLGGYDAGKLVPNAVSFPMNVDPINYLTVNLSNIIISSQGSTTNTLSTPITVSLDSTLPYLWLPQAVCDIFESTFNLVYDETTELYFISNTVEQALESQNPLPSVTFTLTNPAASNQAINITFPFASFNLTAQPPLVANTTNYFPLKRAANSTQYVLGRTFFQEAYIIADFERQNFSISQALFEVDQRENLVTISTPSNTTTNITLTSTPSPSPSSSSGGISGGAIAGIVIGILAVVTIIGAILWWRRRRRRPAAMGSRGPEVAEIDSRIKAKELDAVESGRGSPLPGYHRPTEMEAVESGRASPAAGYHRSPPLASPLSEMDGAVYHELDTDHDARQRQNYF